MGPRACGAKSQRRVSPQTGVFLAREARAVWLQGQWSAQRRGRAPLRPSRTLAPRPLPSPAAQPAVVLGDTSERPVSPLPRTMPGARPVPPPEPRRARGSRARPAGQGQDAGTDLGARRGPAGRSPSRAGLRGPPSSPRLTSGEGRGGGCKRKSRRPPRWRAEPELRAPSRAGLRAAAQGPRRGRAGGAAGVGAERAGGARDSSREETVSEARAARGSGGSALSPFSGRGRRTREDGV